MTSPTFFFLLRCISGLLGLGIRNVDILQHQERKTRCDANSIVSMHESERTDQTRLGQIGKNDDVPNEDAEQGIDSRSRQYYYV